MPEYAWMPLNKPNFENALGPKYVKLLNMGKFWMWHGSQYAKVTQRSQYAWIYLHRVLNLPWVLNMPGFWMWQGSESGNVTQGSKYATILLNMSG